MTSRAHIPQRTCLGCMGRSPQADMVRIVRNFQGHLLPDWVRRAPGRGGYLHEQAACWERFARGKGMLRSLRAVVDRPTRAAFVTQWQGRSGR